MPLPRTIPELFAQTWSDAHEVHGLELYLEDWWEENGHKFPEPHAGGHWVGAAADIRRLAKKSAASATRPPRRRSKPAAHAHIANRVQMELPF